MTNQGLPLSVHATTHGYYTMPVKLNETRVRTIRRMAPTYTQHTLARLHKVSQPTISQCVNRRTWKWVKP